MSTTVTDPDKLKALQSVFGKDLTTSVIGTVLSSHNNSFQDSVDTLISMSNSAPAARTNTFRPDEPEEKDRESLKHLQNMFGDLTQSVIATVYESSKGDLTEAVDNLLNITSKELASGGFKERKEAEVVRLESEVQSLEAFNRVQHNMQEESKKATEAAQIAFLARTQEEERTRKHLEEERRQIMEEQQKLLKSYEQKKEMKEKPNESSQDHSALLARIEGQQKIEAERKQLEDERIVIEAEKKTLEARKTKEMEERAAREQEERLKREAAELRSREEEKIKKAWEERLKQIEVERRKEEEIRNEEKMRLQQKLKEETARREEEHIQQLERDRMRLEQDRLELEAMRKKMEEDKRNAEEKYKLLEAEVRKRDEEEAEQKRMIIEQEKQREEEERQRRDEEQARIAKQQADERKKKQAEDHQLSASVIVIPTPATVIVEPASNDAAAAILTTSVAGDVISGTWALPNEASATPTDWLALFPATQPANTKYTQYMYTRGVAAGQFTFKGVTPGHYDIRFFPNKTYDYISRTAAIRVGPAAAINVQLAGEQVKVQYTFSPTSTTPTRDWIGIYEKTQRRNKKYTTSVYGNASGEVTLKAPRQPGIYEARVFASGSNYNDQARVEFVIEDHDSISVAPEVVHAGGQLSAVWTMLTVETSSSDWVGMFKTDEPNNAKYIVSAYTQGASVGSVLVTVPKDTAAGVYELRLFSKATGKYVTFRTSSAFTVA